MDNLKVEFRETRKYGKSLFAKENIRKDEVILDWSEGKIYTANKASDLPKDILEHAIQFDENKYIDYKGLGRYICHSCNPNCGVRGKFQIVAMRNIKKGEELTYDYEMTDDSDLVMECKCSNKNCRKVISAFKNMPENVRKKYKRYISNWLIEKYNLNK